MPLSRAAGPLYTRESQLASGGSGETASSLDIDGLTDIGADIADADLIIIDDGAGGANRKAALSRLKTYIGAADNTLTTFKYTATAGQTTFSGNDDASNSLSYSAGNLLVILNGSVLINGTDYTASN